MKIKLMPDKREFMDVHLFITFLLSLCLLDFLAYLREKLFFPELLINLHSGADSSYDTQGTSQGRCVDRRKTSYQTQGK